MNDKYVWVFFIIVTLISSAYLGSNTLNECEKDKISDIYEKTERLSIISGWECLTVQVNTSLNFSEKLKINTNVVKNLRFICVEWDFDGDGIIDWYSREDALWRTNKTGNREYAMYTYKRCGIYTSSVSIYYYDALNNTLYNDFQKYIVMVYKEVKRLWAYELRYIPYPIKINGVLNFSNKLEEVDSQVVKNLSFICVKWDFDGDGIIDWYSLDSPKWRLKLDGSKEYATYTYKNCGIYRPLVEIYYYDNDIVYKDYDYMHVIVYRGYVNGSSAVRSILNLNKTYILIKNNSKDVWIDWKINFTNIVNNTLLFRYMHGLPIAIPSYEVDIYIITPEGSIITYRPTVIPSLSLYFSLEPPPAVLYPNQSVEVGGFGFAIGNAQRPGYWYYPNNGTQYYFKKGIYNYSLYMVIHPVGIYRACTSHHLIVDDLYIPTGDLITQSIELTIEVKMR